MLWCVLGALPPSPCQRDKCPFGIPYVILIAPHGAIKITRGSPEVRIVQMEMCQYKLTLT